MSVIITLLSQSIHINKPKNNVNKYVNFMLEVNKARSDKAVFTLSELYVKQCLKYPPPPF